MDELQTIREALESQAKVLEAIDGLSTVTENIKCNDLALEALSRLEARTAEMPDCGKIADRAMMKGAALEMDDSSTGNEWIEVKNRFSAEIGQYAYRYSEDIRKDRDYWKGFAIQFHDTIHKHIEGK